MTLSANQLELAMIDKAIANVLTLGQEYEIGTRQLKRPDLDTLYKRREKLKGLIAREQRGGGVQWQLVVPAT